MLPWLWTAALLSAPMQECTAPILSWHYDASAVTPEAYRKSCLICADAVTIVTESHGREARDTRTATLPELAAPLEALWRAPVDEICDGPMDVAGVEYWLHGQQDKLFSAAGSACWVQSTAVDDAQLVELWVDRLCGGVSMAPARM